MITDTVMAKNLSRSFHTAREIAAVLSVNVMTIYRYIKANRLAAHKIGKEFRISNADFESFLKRVKTKK